MVVKIAGGIAMDNLGSVVGVGQRDFVAGKIGHMANHVDVMVALVGTVIILVCLVQVCVWVAKVH